MYIYIVASLYDRYLPFRRLEFKLVIVTCTDTPKSSLIYDYIRSFPALFSIKHLFAYFLRFFSSS